MVQAMTHGTGERLTIIEICSLSKSSRFSYSCIAALVIQQPGCIYRIKPLCTNRPLVNALRAWHICAILSGNTVLCLSIEVIKDSN